jgi:dTDP-4-dehydrorhamnose 3,5-epimerase
VAELHYKVSRLYDSGDEGGIAWNDPDLAIAWPVRNPRLSARDAAYPRLRDLALAQLPQLSDAGA